MSRIMNGELNDVRIGIPMTHRATWPGILTLGLGPFAGLIIAQNPSPPKGPKEILQQYRRMDADGERLTINGWYAGARFFVKPDRPPQHRAILVMDDERVDDPKIDGTRARVQVICSAVGQIDSSGRFSTVVAPYFLDTSGNLIRKPPPEVVHGPAVLFRMYDLILTDTHWEYGPERSGLRQVHGPPEWKIEGFEYEPWVRIGVAIRYLNKWHEESNGVERNNTDKSLSALRHLLKQ